MLSHIFFHFKFLPTGLFFILVQLCILYSSFKNKKEGSYGELTMSLVGIVPGPILRIDYWIQPELHKKHSAYQISLCTCGLQIQGDTFSAFILYVDLQLPQRCQVSLLRLLGRDKLYPRSTSTTSQTASRESISFSRLNFDLMCKRNPLEPAKPLTTASP